MKNLLFRFRCWRYRASEKIAMWLVWHMPRKLVMWAYIRVGAHATTGQWGNETVGSVKMMDALDRWDVPHTPPRSKMLDPQKNLKYRKTHREPTKR